MRKPKIHPKYSIRLVGISFGTRWNTVSMASEDELKTFIQNVKKIKDINSSKESTWWERRRSMASEIAQNNHFRKLWRKRYSETFKENTLYRSDRNFNRWDIKLAPSTGEGIAASYIFNYHRDAKYGISKGDILVKTGTDELGNLYFCKINEIAAKHSFVFPRTSNYLSYIVPLDE